MSRRCIRRRCPPCRSPHGERGLKCPLVDTGLARLGRSPHGERGLKFGVTERRTATIRRSPHGERGLKSSGAWCDQEAGTSLSSWRAWIEIGARCWNANHSSGRSPHGERGLKFRSVDGLRGWRGSLSSWRAWIEICRAAQYGLVCPVALLMESVD